ncbi:hypothetical protein KIPE111705_07050 [Kibdelosporangium persicum]|uniref:hypothetical protein n=1 Tax=Kibdelosporangium persicum TaxID=2698649 RepID=UPI001565B54E|nr:hypothetical protein [Kibdelosporangium persicum]
MTTISLSPVEMMAGLGVLMVLFMVWRAGSRRAKAAAEAARSGGRFMSLAGRVLFTAGLIVVAQWLVITQAGTGWLLLAVLGLPALFASYTLTRALTVTTRDGRR